jgi:hypothetical protein
VVFDDALQRRLADELHDDEQVVVVAERPEDLGPMLRFC